MRMLLTAVFWLSLGWCIYIGAPKLYDTYNGPKREGISRIIKVDGQGKDQIVFTDRPHRYQNR